MRVRKHASTKQRNKENHNPNASRKRKIQETEEYTTASENEQDAKSKPSNLWTEEDVQVLESAVALVNPTSINFWEQVAQFVPNKSHTECQSKYQTLFRTPKAKKVRTSGKEEKVDFFHLDMNDVQGKMKKKRTIRKLLQHVKIVTPLWHFF